MSKKNDDIEHFFFKLIRHNLPRENDRDGFDGRPMTNLQFSVLIALTAALAVLYGLVSGTVPR